MKILPVIMAGGSGTRLWPLSRENFPKQFIKIFDGKSLLQNSLLRSSQFGKPVVIVGIEHRFIALEQILELGIEADIILEPEGKNTAPCAILASLIGLEKNADTILLMPSDHFIAQPELFAKTAQDAAHSTVKCDVATIGIVPTCPHTGYGYIELGESIGGQSFKAKRFVEKPNYEDAEKYFLSGGYCWNAGIFVFNPGKFLKLSENLLPEMTELVKTSLQKAETDMAFLRLDAESYGNIKGDSIDYGIMEKISDIIVEKARFDWNDLGSFSSIWEISNKNQNNNVQSGDVFEVGCYGNYISTSSKFTAAIGVEDLIIINTEDALLVASKKEAEKVKEVAQYLKMNGRQEAINSAICYRPWGSYQEIDKGDMHKVKRIIVKPSHKLSLQYHNHRAEHWVVVKGIAEVEIGGKISILKENDSIYIPMQVQHRLVNPGPDDLHLIEVQTGSYLGEDDIVRLTDIYGRK